MSEEVVPIYAEGIHVFDLLGNVWLVLICEYRDPKAYYYNLVKKGGSEIIEELETMMSNMQKFLDEEISTSHTFPSKSNTCIPSAYIGTTSSLIT